MGYLSDVAICLTKEGYKGLRKEFLKKDVLQCSVFDKVTFINAKGNETDEASCSYVILKAIDTKWYENDEYFPGVELVMNYLKDNSSTMSYHLIIIGECIDDIREESNIVDNDNDIISFLYIKRSIECITY